MSALRDKIEKQKQEESQMVAAMLGQIKTTFGGFGVSEIQLGDSLIKTTVDEEEEIDIVANEEMFMRMYEKPRILISFFTHTAGQNVFDIASVTDEEFYNMDLLKDVNSKVFFRTWHEEEGDFVHPLGFHAIKGVEMNEDEAMKPENIKYLVNNEIMSGVYKGKDVFLICKTYRIDQQTVRDIVDHEKARRAHDNISIKRYCLMQMKNSMKLLIEASLLETFGSHGTEKEILNTMENKEKWDEMFDNADKDKKTAKLLMEKLHRKRYKNDGKQIFEITKHKR